MKNLFKIALPTIVHGKSSFSTCFDVFKCLFCPNGIIQIFVPLFLACVSRSNIAVAIRAVSVEKNSTSTLDLLPESAALNKCTHYECEIRSRCAYKHNALKARSYIRIRTLWLDSSWTISHLPIATSNWDSPTGV